MVAIFLSICVNKTCIHLVFDRQIHIMTILNYSSTKEMGEMKKIDKTGKGTITKEIPKEMLKMPPVWPVFFF